MAYNIFMGINIVGDDAEVVDSPDERGESVSIDPDIQEPRSDSHETLLQASKTLTDQLTEDLSGVAEVSTVQMPGLEGREMIRIDVSDKETWASEENLRKLLNPFGEVLFDSYRDRDDPSVFPVDDPEAREKFFQENMIGTDLSLSDDVYVVAEQGRVIGLMCSRSVEFANGMRADEALLTGVVRSQEGTPLGRQLYEFMLENTTSDALISVSHTPSAVKNGIRLGDAKGWNVYYGGLRDGDPGKQMTEAETSMLARVEGGMKAMVADDPDIGHFQDGIPPHYISYGDLGIPPRKLEELRFKEGDPLRGTFEDLIHWQMENRPEHTIYGMLISIRKSAVS